MQLNDYELISLAREGNEEAIKLIYEKYKPLIIKKGKDAIKHANHHGIDINDIIQEGYMAVDEAIRNFNQHEDASFYTFVSICIERKISSFIRKTTNKKSMVLNDAITLDDNLGKTISDSMNVEKTIINKDDGMEKINLLKASLTTLEDNVFEMRINGYSFEEIAKILNKDLKAIYNAFNRIKIKYKKIRIDN